MPRIIIGNIIMLVASMIMVLTGLIKNKKTIIIWQTVQIGLSAIGNLVLGSFAGTIDNSIGCIRNILCYKNKLNIITKIIIILIYSVLTFTINNMGWVGILLWAGSVFYILLMDIKDVVKFKVLVMCTMINWMIHDLSAHSYVAFAFDMGTVVANIIAIIKIKRGGKKNYIE